MIYLGYKVIHVFSKRRLGKRQSYVQFLVQRNINDTANGPLQI